VVTPGPHLRRGPRPLLLHLALGMLWPPNQSLAGSPGWKPGSPNWNALLAERAAILAGALGRANPEAGLAGLLAAAPQPDPALIAGIAAYRRHPYVRTLADPLVLWAEGSSRVLDHGAGGGVPVLFVPSLVNRAYVLDLMDGHSMLRWLAGQGLRPLLLDWGWPGEVERRFTLTDYVAGRLERALGFLAPQRPVLAGYCMGGNLALAAAARVGEALRGLALLATPWDFHAGTDGRGALLGALVPALEPLMALGEALPVDALQMLFALLDPPGVGEKYRNFGRLDQGSDRARLFVALEDWLNDGIPLAAPVARECLAGWYGENRPMRGDWRIAGAAVDPGAVRVPTLVAVPARDRIVPPESARPLAGLIPGAALLEPAAGHIGMVAGGTAERALWRPLRDWALGLG